MIFRILKIWIASGSGKVWGGSFATDIDIESEMNPFHKIWRNEDIWDRLQSLKSTKMVSIFDVGLTWACQPNDVQRLQHSDFMLAMFSTE